MSTFAVRQLGDRIGIDLGTAEDNFGQSRFYDGRPTLVDSYEISQAEIAGTIELSDAKVEQIEREYAEGGECHTCGEVARKLRELDAEMVGKLSLLPLDPDDAPARICCGCWNEERSRLLNPLHTKETEDIGPFDEHDKYQRCVQCHHFVSEHKQLGIEEEFGGGIICDDCAQAMGDMA